MLAGAGVIGVGVDAVTFGAHDLAVERITVPLSRLPLRLDGFTIAQMSDFHYSALDAPVIEAGVREANRLSPDLIVLTGDFVTQSIRYSETRDRESARAAGPCAQLLSKLRARHGVFAVLGNHDQLTDPEFVSEALGQHGIRVLQNSSVPIEQDGSRLWLAGVEDVMRGDPDLDRALQGVPGGEPTVLLAHEPDYADEVSRTRVDLQLSGHSHGGQIRFPLLGALYLPPLARKYPMGLYRLGPLILYTNRGLGTIRIPARLNCPPEITLVTLKAQKT